ncbi:MAG: hypothetical protein OEZ21_08105 [Candidatus Bathyarchaeota archaeon]|nr:hypothetical protein [Candidatus Bathyarchaeota archaeon]MDH5746899.1 hypothetical protein [Candidatus Bathyarchaeota archaeon]
MAEFRGSGNPPKFFAVIGTKTQLIVSTMKPSKAAKARLNI